MNEIINIYVEGQGEIMFLAKLIEHHFNIQFTIDKPKLTAKYKNENQVFIIQVFDPKSMNGGIDRKKINNLMRLIAEKIPTGDDQHYLIIDTDTEKHRPKGGYSGRVEYLEELKENHKIDFEYFLIPNNKDDGNLENLLNEIISAKGKDLHKCVSNYKECLNNLPDRSIIKRYDKIDEKLKFGWLVFLATQDNKTSLSTRDYSLDIWDMNSEGLNPLVTFLRKIFEKKKHQPDGRS